VKHDNETPKVPVDIDWSEVKNWAEKFAQPRLVKTTSMKTHVVDATGATGAGKAVQIAAYEPARVRTLIQALDADVVLLTQNPSVVPDATVAAGIAPADGMVIPKANTVPTEFYGPDALWINSITGVTRVNVVKEYTNG
jgi:hypothetical protein